jgi:AcrR family transcriptional regulator
VASSEREEGSGVTGSGRPYHHGDLRAALLDAALQMSRGDGPTAVSLREVTRRAGVSPAAAYRHFRDRTQLMGAVAREIQDRMAQRMRERMDTAGDCSAQDRALQHVRGVGLGYIAFAVDEPGWFQTAFFGIASEAAGPVPSEAAGGGRESVPAPFALLTSALDQCVEAGVLTAVRRDGAEYVCWSAVHGCAQLLIHGPLRAAPRSQVRQVAERVVDDVIAGIR